MMFYTLDMCPYAQRCWIVLEELGVGYERRAVNLMSNSTEREWYERNVNPRGKVPALVDGSTVVYESLICNEYLCDKHESALLPREAAARARIRLWNEHCDSQLSPALFTYLMNKDDATEAETRGKLADALAYYERRLVGPFLDGEAFTLADANAIPFFERLDFSLQKFKNVDMLADCPRLRAWYDRTMARPSVAVTKRPEAALTQLYQKFLDADYAFGGLNRN